MLHTEKHRTAAITLQHFYRQYLQKKRTQFRLPESLYRAREHSTTGAIYTFLVSKLNADDGLHVSVAGKKSLMASLNAGNYALLEFYLQQGIDPRGFICDAYFRGKGVDQASLDLLDAIGDSKAAADELTDTAAPGKKIRCFPILDNAGRFTRPARDYLLPYLRHAYPFINEDELVLQNKINAIPKAEHFFTTVDINDTLQLAALKMVIENCFTLMKRNMLLTLYHTISTATDLFTAETNPYNRQLKSVLDKIKVTRRDHYSYDIYLQLTDIGKLLDNVYYQLLHQHPFLKNHTINSNFHLQLIYSSQPLVFPIASPNKKTIAQVLMPGSVMDICHEIAYGAKNKVSRFIGYGKFNASDIAAFTQLKGRLINAQGGHVAGLTKAHNAMCRPWTLRFHDVLHWHRMSSVPEGIRTGVISWAKMLEKETGFALSKLSYAFYDMDFSGYERYRVDNIIRTSIAENISILINYYGLVTNSDVKYNLLGYHLIITFEILRDPSWMNRVFSHCSEANPVSYLHVFLQGLCAVTSITASGYNDVRRYFNPNYSTTHNVFRYLISDAVRTRALYAWEAELLIYFSEKVNIFKWTRNGGLKLSYGGTELDPRDIYTHNFIQALTLFYEAASTDIRLDLLAHLKAKLASFSANDFFTKNNLNKIREKFFPEEDKAMKNRQQSLAEFGSVRVTKKHGFFSNAGNRLKQLFKKEKKETAVSKASDKSQSGRNQFFTDLNAKTDKTQKMEHAASMPQRAGTVAKTSQRMIG